MGLIIAKISDESKLEKWKCLILLNYGRRGGIKKRIEQMIEEDLKRFGANDKQ